MADSIRSERPVLSVDAVRRIVDLRGEPGVTWVERLPALLSDLAEAWSLREIATPFDDSGLSFVAPVVGPAGNALVLKVVPVPIWASHEASALTCWSGNGAVLLEHFDPDRGALLLERAVPGSSAVGVAQIDDSAATEAVVSVIQRLRESRADPAPDLPDISSWTVILERTELEDRTPALVTHSARAAAVAAELLTGSPRTVLHGDLHHANVLRAERATWLAIDPKGIVGPPEAEAAAMLRNPRRVLLSAHHPAQLVARRLDIICERLGDEPQRAAAWAYVLAVVAAAWAHEDGAGGREIERWLACAEILHRHLDSPSGSGTSTRKGRS